MSTYVTATGAPFDMAAAQAQAKEAAKRRKAATTTARTGHAHDDFMSLGFVVEGLTREMLANARDARQRAIANYPAECELAKEQQRAAPKKPAEWDEDTWLRTAKRMKVRAKPYEIRSAAEECKALALKQGWLVVEVSEVRRERK